MESVVGDHEFFKRRGLLNTNVGVEAVVDNGYAERSVKLLGPYKPKGG